MYLYVSNKGDLLCVSLVSVIFILLQCDVLILKFQIMEVRGQAVFPGLGSVYMNMKP